MPRSQCEKENVQLVQELAEVDGPFESPINLNFRDLIKLELPSLRWNKPDSVPKKMKITNTGHTVIISGKWKCERPYLTGGPLDGKYVFSQIHFHWGPDNCKGSEHQVCGESFPLEMHVAHFKTEYMTQESALREKDGMVVLVYLFKLQEEPNNSLKKVINALPCIRQANSSLPLECKSILALCNPFTDDYFMYWGSVITSTCAHILLWIVCREPFGISREQMEEFRKICDKSQQPIRRNSRDPQPLHKRNVFHVNASRNLDDPLLPIKNIMGCFCHAGDENERETKKSEGDGGCNCSAMCGAQEELEGRQDPHRKREMEKSRGNGVYLQQTVYCQHAAVHHSVPILPNGLGDPVEEIVAVDGQSEDKSPDNQHLSQSCCFLSIEEEKSVSGEKRPKERRKERKRKPIDSVTTLANLIETLETLKTQTYKKLKEIETINQEIRGMKTSCENLEEKHWLRQAEKIISRHKRFTIRSSQCCFTELKKLAKECNFDKLLENRLFAGTDEEKSFLLGKEETADGGIIRSKGSGDKLGFAGLGVINSTPLGLSNSERFSRKAEKLIRSFFEDIKESEEAQINLERNLLKKFEKLSKKRSDQSDVSTMNNHFGQIYVTKNMMNVGPIRDRFFTEISLDENAAAPAETKMVPAGKKKNKSFFKTPLNAFDSKSATAKKPKKTLFTKSPFAWLNNRLSIIQDTSPVFPLRIANIELKDGSINTRKKSKHSVRNPSPRKAVSEEHICTEVSSFLSESFISEFSDKQSRHSKQSRTQTKKSITRSVERNTEKTKKNEVSVMRMVKDIDTNNFFIQLNNSGNMSSATSTDSERKNTKFIKRRSRKDLWEKGSSMMSGFCNDTNDQMEGHYEKSQNVHYNKTATGNMVERRISTSSDSSLVIKRRSKQEIVQIKSYKPSKSEIMRSIDASVDATEAKPVVSPKRKKLKLEWNRKNLHLDPQQVHAVSYMENECQADLNTKVNDKKLVKAHSQEAITCIDQSEQTLERCRYVTKIGNNAPNNDHVSESDTAKESAGYSARRMNRNTSVDAGTPTSHEKDLPSERENKEESIPQRKSSDLQNEPKTFFEIKRTVVLSTPREPVRNPEYTRTGKSPVIEEVNDGLKATSFQQPLLTGEEEKPPTPQTTTERHTSPDSCYSSPPTATPTDKKLKNNIDEGFECMNLFTVKESVKSPSVSQDASQNELSECNEYDIKTDSNGAMNHDQEKDIHSGNTTPSTFSSDDEKQRDTSAATESSVLRTNSQQNQFSVESFKSFKNAFEMKQRKKRQCIKKKSRQLLRKNNSMIRKMTKIGGSNLDLTKLTEDEQLRIISANAARFVKQKLVEHKEFFDFKKNEAMTFDVEKWSKAAEESERADLTQPVVITTMEEEGVKEQNAVILSPSRQSTPPPLLSEVKTKPENITPAVTPNTKEVVSRGGDAEKNEKTDSGRQTLDFIKLNKIMAGKYKRRGALDTGKRGGKKGTTKEKDTKKEGVKPVVAKPGTANKEPQPITSTGFPQSKNAVTPAKPGVKPEQTISHLDRGFRTPSADSARRGTDIARGQKSDIPMPYRDTSGSPKPGRVNVRSASATPATAKTQRIPIANPPLALQKVKQQPKKRLVPTYTLTSYLSAPNEVIEYQQRELDKYLTQNSDVTELIIDETKFKNYKRKKIGDSLFKKNLDHLIMLQKRINHEISANIENSMNYVTTLLSQDYNGTAIIEKAPVKNSLDVFDTTKGGVVLIEMNDQFDCSSSGSEFSEESGFYCIYQGRNRRDKNRNIKHEIIVKRNESGDSGLVDSRILEELQNDTDSSYNCEVSIVVTPKEVYQDRFDNNQPSEIDILKKYIYHLGGGEESSCLTTEAFNPEEVPNPKPQLKKRKERVLDIPMEMKRKLLDKLEDEMKSPIREKKSDETVMAENSKKDEEDAESENTEMMSKISEMVKQYLDEYGKKQNADAGGGGEPPDPSP